MDEITKDKDNVMDALQSLLQFRARGYSEPSASLPSSNSAKLPVIKTEVSEKTAEMKKQKTSSSPSRDKRSSSDAVRQGKKKARISNDSHSSNGSQNRSFQSPHPELIQPRPQPQPERESTSLPRTPSSASNLLQRGLFFPHHLGSPLSASSSALQSLHHHSRSNATMAHIQLVAAQAAMAAAANAVASVSNGQRLDSNAHRHQLLSPHQQPIASPSSTVPSSLSYDGSSAQEEEEAANVRREKVEEALRSKPQRGKKREDLSAKERLELTRTRNREHAKTTRIRKKARYQELLDCESKLQVLLQEQAAKDLQLKAVETFVSLRQNMIRCCQEDMVGYDYDDDHHHHHLVHQSSSLVGKEDEPQVLPKSSSSPQVDPVKVVATTKPVDHASILAKLVDDVNRFELKVSPKVDTTEAEEEDVSPDDTPLTSSMILLKAVDRHLVRRAAEQYGDGVQQYVCCQVGEGGIALNATSAMATIELHLELSPGNRTHLQTCLLQVKFSPSQPVLLQSVSWTVLEDYLEDGKSNKMKSSSKLFSRISKQLKADDDDSNESPLSSQSVFPSIVSLEQSKAARDRGNSNDATSLGMPL